VPRTEGRGEEALPGVFRLRLPMPWPEAPLGNAWALAHGDGLVLIDTGVGGGEALARLEEALAQVGHRLADVRQVVCTHAHADHIGLAAPIVAATGAPLWIHPAWEYIRPLGEDPAGQWDRRWEFMARHGAATAAIDDFRTTTTGWNVVEGIAEPDVLLGPEVTFESDLGVWQVHPTPGHDPAHVVFLQPDHRLLIGGDLLIEGAALFFEYGYSPDPVAEFLASLDLAERLDFDLCLPGHGRAIDDAGPVLETSRAVVIGLIEGTDAALAGGDELSAGRIATELLGDDADKGSYFFRGIQNALAALDHLRLRGRAVRIDGADGLVTWRRV
jgi:glyoxylase-like metal-dependent hydrolase (beta-lactamase superfamily II)